MYYSVTGLCECGLTGVQTVENQLHATATAALAVIHNLTVPHGRYLASDIAVIKLPLTTCNPTTFETRLTGQAWQLWQTGAGPCILLGPDMPPAILFAYVVRTHL